MNCPIKNNTNQDLSQLIGLANRFYPYAKKRLNFDKHPTISFESDPENAEKPLGRTAHYDPDGSKVVIMIDNRHFKDILRSLAHELVHHAQNCRGDLVNMQNTPVGYAQEDGDLREMEREAYEQGNLCFRDWEDNIKKTNMQLYETIYKTKALEGDIRMSTKNWKNNELNTILMEKWGYAPKKEAEKEALNEEVDAYMTTKADYKGLDKEISEDDEELKEGEEDVAEAESDPMEAGSRLENLEETALYKAVLNTVKDILSEKDEI